MNIIKKSLSNIDVSDIFFDSLRNDYPNFNEWFLRKKKENYYAYVTMDKNNKLLSFLMLKEENYQELNDVVKKYDLVNKKFLKVSTFKVSYTGNGIGNKYLSIIDVTAKKVGACLIYITVYPKLEVFIEFLKRHGYIVVGNYNKELVLVKKVKD